MKTTNEIRQDFLDFFCAKGHTVVPSSSLVPGNDPTLLFTNAGMVQFKDVFLGAEKRTYTRAVSSQRCVRAGGKHNDLDQVGYTARHHTFFEMLGNFSFGDYFKHDAIAYAWELLTGVWKLPAERLLVTIYHTDDEAFDIWHRVIGLPTDRIVRIGDNKGAPYASDNFWQMADTGPCGPCTEIFYDHGADIPGGLPGSPDEDGDRYIEIWNNVFMQFDRAADGTLTPLPAPCVDTGMGLERVAAVLQHVHSNYQIDLFLALVEHAGRLTRTTNLQNTSLRVIADHIRACAFLIVDGVLPSNESRGYVLRRIIRRALRHGWMLGVRGSFFHRMLDPLVALMGQAYPELTAKRATIDATLRAEEERFAETLGSGMRVFEDVAARAASSISGSDAFRLYDTYGFPVDLTADIARERGLSVDMAGFEAAMEEQRRQGRSASRFAGAAGLPADVVATLQPTEFLGYDAHDAVGLPVAALLHEDRIVQALAQGERGIVILERTPFYAESGGQVGDQGFLSHGEMRFEVSDTIKLAGQFHGHVGTVRAGRLHKGDHVGGSIDIERRQATVRNHSATHLLHAALRKLLGDHVQQKGSLVAPDRLRFDFSHFQPISAADIVRIETLVNEQVRHNVEAQIHTMGMQEALDFGAMALFGEKYGERVRVLRMGDFSTELCGGTHVGRTGDIGLFKIVSESGVAAGVRRIEAVSGQGALDHVAQEEQTLAELAYLLGVNRIDVLEKARQLLERQKRLERDIESFKAKASASTAGDLAASAVEICGIKVVAARLEGLDGKALRDSVDQLKQRLGDAVIVLAAVSAGKASLVAGVSGSALSRVKAGELLSHIAAQIGGKGGGRADLAQGGGDDGPALMAAIDGVGAWVRARLGA